MGSAAVAFSHYKFACMVEWPESDPRPRKWAGFFIFVITGSSPFHNKSEYMAVSCSNASIKTLPDLYFRELGHLFPILSSDVGHYTSRVARIRPKAPKTGGFCYLFRYRTFPVLQYSEYMSVLISKHINVFSTTVFTKTLMYYDNLFK